MFGHLRDQAIYIFYGKMGSGKTTNAVSQVLEFHQKGRPVWVNFPMEQVPPSKDGAPAPIFYEDDPAGILSMRDGLFVIDEAYMTLNAREWANLPKHVFTAFTHTRKLHMTIIVIAQSWMRIDKSIREVASYARHFHGGSLFGTAYPYHEYEIDELGEIIKAEEVEYNAASRGLRLVSNKVYNAFNTDYLFETLKDQHKTWPSAIGYRPAAPAEGAGRREEMRSAGAAGRPSAPSTVLEGSTGRPEADTRRAAPLAPRAEPLARLPRPLTPPT